MKRIGLLMLFLFLGYSIYANHIEDTIVSDDISSQVDRIKRVIGSKEWVPTDSVSFQYITSLLELIGNQPIDSVVNGLSNEMKDREIFFIRDYQKKYLDWDMNVDSQVFARYNDSETVLINKILKEDIQSLITHILRIPDELKIYNLRNEQSSLSLQEGEKWFQWIWLKNVQNDSIGIRIENIGRRSVRMLVDESVNLSKLTIRGAREVDKLATSKYNEQRLLKVATRNPVLSPWKLVGKAYAGFTQNYINEFWSQGGKSSASALTTINYIANYSKIKFKWENFADLKLGLIYYLTENGDNSHQNWHKNSDNLELNTRIGYSAFKKWYYSAEANFKTQFFLGFKSVNDSVPFSAFFSPAYLTFSAGMEFKPGKDLSLFLSPVSLKTTYVTNPLVDETKFGLDEGDTYKGRIGFSGKFDYCRNLLENISLKTKNSLFVNFGNNQVGEWQFLKLPDFDSETSVDFKVNQFISTQVNFHLVYDKDVESAWLTASGDEVKGTRLQAKEFFTLGFSYKF
jgi:hypothetical protein